MSRTIFVKRYTPTLHSHVYNLSHALRLVNYIRSSGVLDNNDEGVVKASLEKAKTPRECIRKRREAPPLGVLVHKMCSCCKRAATPTVKDTYCVECKRDLVKEVYHLKKAFAALKPSDTTCQLCERKSSRPLHLDHDHADGEARAWLCDRCNCTIGLVEKSLPEFQQHCRDRFSCEDVLSH